MNWRRLDAALLSACLACSSTTVPGNTLALLDGTGETISVGRVTLTAKATPTPIATPGGGVAGPAIGVALDVTRNPPDINRPLLTCVDVRLYTQASGGSLGYSQNQALNRPCSGPMNGFGTGPSGVTQGVGVIDALRDADVVPKTAQGTYFIRFRVTFPDSSVAEVLAGTIGRG
jgi:hypothetical protein